MVSGVVVCCAAYPVFLAYSFAVRSCDFAEVAYSEVHSTPLNLLDFRFGVWNSTDFVHNEFCRGQCSFVDRGSRRR